MSAEAGVAVQVEHIKPGDHVVSLGSDIFDHFIEVFSTFVIRRASLKLVLRPLINFEVGLLGVFADPGQHLGIGFSVLQQFQNIVGADAEKRG